MTFQQEAKDALRAAGGRITSQRELLLDLLADSDGDIDAEQLFRLASGHDATISLPTIYRTLNTLESAKLVRSHYVSSDHERKAYRISSHGGGTFHFTCRQCGQITPFPADVVERIKLEIGTQSGAEIKTLCMCAGGLCANCREETTG